MIAETSQKAFKHDVLPTIGARQAAVMEVLLELGEATNTELARRLGWPINTVTPRVCELRKAGFVVEKGKRFCKVTGRLAYCWQASPGQMSLLP